MDYIATYQYTKIHAIDLEIPKYGIRFLFNYLIVRKIGISCEVIKCLFFPFFIILLCSSNKMHHAPFISINIFSLQIHSPIHFNFDYMVAYRV